MDASFLRKFVPINFFFDVAEGCHTIFVEDPSLPPIQRIFRTLELGPSRKHLDHIAETLGDNTVLAAFLDWFIEQLTPYVDEISEELSKPEFRQLHYRRYDEADAAWNNLNVSTERGQLARALTEQLTATFPGWDIGAIQHHLTRVPPLVLLNQEFSAFELKVRSKLSIDFAAAFLKSAYIVHLGVDCLPDDLLDRNQTEGLDSKIHLLMMDKLRNRRPRYTTLSHRKAFAKIVDIPPFKSEYANAKLILGEETDEQLAEETLPMITFPMSISYAHSILTSSRFLKDMENTDVLGSMYNHHRVMNWICTHGSYVGQFANPNLLPSKVVEECVPMSIEFFNYQLEGTFAVEHHTSLDGLRAGNDDEFEE